MVLTGALPLLPNFAANFCNDQWALLTQLACNQLLRIAMLIRVVHM